MYKLSFAVLGALGIAGFFMWDQGTEESPQSLGSVTVSSALESTHLLADGGESTFALISLRGEEVPAAQERLPISLTLVIDISGSMFGDKIDNAKLAASHTLDLLQRGDRVSVVSFSSNARAIVDVLEIGQENGALAKAKEAVHALQAGGGTNMRSALSLAKIQAQKIFATGRVNRVMLMSDGHPDTEVGLAEGARRLANVGVTLTTLGLGLDYNEDLMGALADKGNGNYYFIERAGDMQEIFAVELKSMASVVGQNAVVSVSGLGGVRVEKVYGYESASDHDVTAIPVGDIYGGQTRDVLVRLHVPSGWSGDKDVLRVKASYHDALAEKDMRHAQLLSARFVDDRELVLSNAQPEVLEKAERVRTAQAMEDAGAAIAKGDREEADKIFAEQEANIGHLNAVLGTLRGKKGSGRATTKARKMQKDFAAMAGTARTAPVMVYEKKAKAAARGYRR